MANLEKFKATIGGGVRPNQFKVEITPPSIITASSALTEKFTVLCHSASLPSSAIGQATAFHRGRPIPLGGERVFQPWTIVVYNDTTFSLRSMFERWSDSINYYDTAAGETNPEMYKTDRCFVTQLDRNGASLKQYQIMGIFPLEIGDIPLSWAQNDVIEEFAVTFAVERIEPFPNGSVINL